MVVGWGRVGMLALKMPPPAELAELSLMVEAVTVSVPLLLTMPPPAELAELPLMVEAVTVAVRKLSKPPPAAVGEVLVMVEEVAIAARQPASSPPAAENPEVPLGGDGAHVTGSSPSALSPPPPVAAPA